MDVPSPVAGVVKEVKVKVGDKVSEGSLLLTVDADAAPAGVAPAQKIKEGGHSTAPGAPAADYGAAGVYEAIDVRVPDIGDFKDMPVIEVLVKPGDTVKAEDSADHAGIRQGDDGCAVAGRGHGGRSEGEGRRQGRGRHAYPDAVDRCGGCGTRTEGQHTERGRPSRRQLPRPTPAAPTSNARCSCSALAPAATPRRSAPPTSA